MKTFLKIISRRWKEILIITLLTAGLTVILGFFYNKSAFSNTIFISVGAKQQTGYALAVNPYETVQAADQFSESVQGWFKNPAFIEKINTQAEYKVDLSARKQEKQNLVITFRTETEEQAEKVSQVTERILRDQIARYNRETGNDFRLPIFNLTIKEGTYHLALFGVFGLIIGFFLGYALSAILEKFIYELHHLRHGKS